MIVTCDMCLFLNSTCDNVDNKQQGHATLPFLKIDMRHWGAPSRAPTMHAPSAHWTITNPVLVVKRYLKDGDG